MVFSGIPLAVSHENHLSVYVSEMENPSLICSSPGLLWRSLCALLCPHPITQIPWCYTEASDWYRGSTESEVFVWAELNFCSTSATLFHCCITHCAVLPHLLPLNAGRDGHDPWCQPHPPWVRCPLAPLRTSACPVGWVRCMMRTRLFALKTALDSLQGFLPSSGTRYKSHKSCV